MKNATFWRYFALYFSVMVAVSIWAFFCYTKPESAPVSDLISMIKLYLVSAGTAILALYRGPKDPTAQAPVTQ